MTIPKKQPAERPPRTKLTAGQIRDAMEIVRAVRRYVDFAKPGGEIAKQMIRLDRILSNGGGK